jgi:hypothetical protein
MPDSPEAGADDAQARVGVYQETVDGHSARSVAVEPISAFRSAGRQDRRRVSGLGRAQAATAGWRPCRLVRTDERCDDLSRHRSGSRCDSVPCSVSPSVLKPRELPAFVRFTTSNDRLVNADAVTLP